MWVLVILISGQTPGILKVLLHRGRRGKDTSLLSHGFIRKDYVFTQYLALHSWLGLKNAACGIRRAGCQTGVRTAVFGKGGMMAASRVGLNENQVLCLSVWVWLGYGGVVPNSPAMGRRAKGWSVLRKDGVTETQEVLLRYISEQFCFVKFVEIFHQSQISSPFSKAGGL